MNRIIACIVSTLFVLFSHAAVAEEPSGSVCVASRTDDPWWKTPPPQATSSGGLRLRVDKRTAVPWPQKESLKIEGLDLHDRHLLGVLDANGKPIESLWFRFSTYKSTDLCMTYDGYQGVGLQDKTRRTPWCKCH